MPTTLFEHRTRERDRRTAEETAWRTALSAAQTELVEREGPDSQLTAARRADDDLEAINRDIERLRERLERSTTPVEMNSLAAQIAARTLDRNLQIDVVLTADAALDATKALAASYELRLRAASQQRAAAEEALAAAGATRDRLNVLRAALAVAPLSSLPANALAELTGAAITAARARIDPPRMPASLFTLVERRFIRLEARRRQAIAHLGAAERARADELRADGGTPGAAQAEGVLYDQAVSAIETFVSGAENRLDFAIATLTSIGNADAWSNEVATALAQDAAARDASAALALTYEQAQIDLDLAQAARDIAALPLRAADPLASEATIDGDPSIAVEVAAVAAANAALTTADGLYTPGDRDRILAWQAELPEAGWDAVRSFLRARRILQDLAGAIVDAVNPASFTAQLDTAEGVYGDALEAAALHRRALARHDAELGLAAARRETAVASAEDTLRSALRGNGR